MTELAPLRFGFDDFGSELETIKELTSKRFFDTSAEWIFPQLKQVLKQLKEGSNGRIVNWEVTESTPLKTIPTTEFEPGRRDGGIEVVGEVSWCWQIQKCSQQKGRSSSFQIAGNASVKFTIRREGDPSLPRIAMWRVECGAHDSPGCFFHTQILGDTDVSPFPRSLSIPRLPTLFVTPMAAIEFFLGELFQDTWAQRVTGNHGQLDYWKAIQQGRLNRLLDWKRKQIEGCQGSPWLALKQAKPTLADSLFVGDR